MDEVVANVNVVEQVGLHEVGEKDTVTPVGKTEVTEKETVWVVPKTRVAAILFVVELPCITVLLPEFSNKKLNKSNLAFTVLAKSIVTSHVLVPVQIEVHPINMLVDEGAAVKVTILF